MAKYTGAVRFPDAVLMYFVYNGTVDTVRPRLYETVAEADAAWDVPTDDSVRKDRGQAQVESSEAIEVMPYFSVGDKRPMFTSRADRILLIITGPLSLDDATTSRDDSVW